MFASTNIRNPHLGPIGPITYTLGRQPDPPPCICTECTQQYRKVDEQHTWVYVYKGAINNAKADVACTEMISSINGNRAFLQRELTLRGLAIAKRWRKKTLKNRESLLKSVDPDMYDRKWHEGHIGYETRYDNWLVEARKYQNIHLLPYMSIENLKEDSSRLIKLLQLRTKYSPGELAPAENRRLSFAWTTGILETTFNGCAIIMHGPKYGSLVPWVRDEVHRGDSIGFPRGQLILKAQSRLLSVLRGIVEVLIDGLPGEEEPTNSINPSLLDLPNAGENTAYVDEAFSSCPTFDLEKLAEIGRERLESARDHLSHLQTDPAYMRRYVQLIQKSEYSKLPENFTFVMTVEDLDYEAWTIRHWTWISEEISELKQIQARFADQINRGQAVPPKYGNKLASFEVLILHLLDMQSRHIQCGLPYRPGFQHHYNFENSTVDGTMYLKHSYKGRGEDLREQAISNAEAFVKDPLHWCVLSLTTNPDCPGTLDKFRLLEFLDQHLDKATPEERARIDETLLRKISDLAAFSELLTLVRSHRPHAVQRDMAEVRTTDESLAWRFMSKTMVKSEFSSKGERITNERTLQEIPLDYATLGPLLKAFMDQEPPKDISDRGWVIKDITLRKSLRCFWDGLRQQHQKKPKDAGISRADIADDLKLISADSDPAFLAVLEAERKEFLSSTASVPSSNKETRPRPRQARRDTDVQQEKRPHGVAEPVKVSAASSNIRAKKDVKFDTAAEIRTEWGTTPIDTKPVSATKVKPKTRGEALSINQELENLNITAGDCVQQPLEKIPIKKSAFEVISSLFPGEEVQRVFFGISLSVPWPP
jgi:hypothetical protein